MSFQRLSNNISPINYNLTLHPDLNGDKFTGNIVITIKVSFFYIIYRCLFRHFRNKIIIIYYQLNKIKKSRLKNQQTRLL
jgi:hypothetical protein